MYKLCNVLYSCNFYDVKQIYDLFNRLIENDCVAFKKLDISAHTQALVQFVSISGLLTLFGDLISLGFFFPQLL